VGRREILAVVAAVAVLSAVVGWVAGQRIKSPGEIAAEQEPPEPSLITVPVELRTLSQNVVVRGTIRPSDETPLPVSSILGTSLITRLAKEAGDTIEEGDVLIEVAGRPVIALEGTLPAFRNLIPGLDGPDVEQLEEALVRLGYDPGPVDGTYTDATAGAVDGLYRDRGYAAPEPDDALQAAVRSAEEAVEVRQQALDEANAALAAARSPVTDLERRRLDLAVAQAEAQLDAARAAATEAETGAAQAILTAEQELADARSASSTAAERLAMAEGGTHPDTGQPPTAAELAELRSEASAAARAVTAAESALASAESARPRIETEQDLAVTSAELAVADAREARSERLDPPDVSVLRRAVDDATKALQEARTDLSDARSDVGAWLPTSEVVFLSAMPRQVASLSVEVGDVPTDSVMTITGGETVIESGIADADRKLIEVGAEAVVEDDDLGLRLPAVVTFLADSPGGPSLSADRYAMRLEATEEIPEEAINGNFRISIPITSSGGDVLAVPLAALSAGADGTARVEVERIPGQTDLVEVSTGLRAEGFVEITPLDGSLEAGDRVVVGRDLVLPGTEGSDGRGESDS
jgi:multidrug efflux pump subunit AcrA (membrane-fusion protein)